MAYDMRQQERADTRKAARRRRAEDRELSELNLENQELMDKLSAAQESKVKEVSELKGKLEVATKKIADLQTNVDNARKDEKTAQERLTFTTGILERFLPALPSEKLGECGAELCQKFKADQPELLVQLFQSFGFHLQRWRSWEAEYSDKTESMLKAFDCPEKQEAGKLSLFRLKLIEKGIAVDAINAVRDYRDLKISLAQLQDRTRPHVRFRQEEGIVMWIQNDIPENLRPRLTEDGLRIATEQLNKEDTTRKLEWLETVEKLLKPENAEIAHCLAVEKRDTPKWYLGQK
jgi:hypothetical protein